MFLKDFFTFLKEYNVMALAIAFVMGTSTDALVKSTVNNLVMPLLGPLFVADSWRDSIWNIGPFHIGLGAFFADLLHFIILAFIIFLFVRHVMKLDKFPGKK